MVTKTTTRIQFDLPTETVRRMDDLAKQSGAKSRKEFLLKALATQERSMGIYDGKAFAEV